MASGRISSVAALTTSSERIVVPLCRPHPAPRKRIVTARIMVIELRFMICHLSRVYKSGSAERRVAAPFQWHEFQSYLTAELSVFGPVHLTHPASADLLDDAVVPEGATDEVLHCLGSQRAYVIAVKGAIRDLC